MLWVMLLAFFKVLMMKVMKTSPLAVAENPSAQIPEDIFNKHYRRPVERPFYKDERSTTTVLLGGLSYTHDRLMAAALRNLNIKAFALPPTSLSSFELGREYGNNGYCNPTYFTVGNLLAYLKELEDSGLSKEEIIEKYAFITAGCNAPCRFGLIEIEYRMALKDAGYQGFRVLVFKKEDGLSQSVRGLGIEINPTFFLALVNAINMADILISRSNEIRPHEINKGETDRVKEKATVKLCELLENRKKLWIKEKWWKFFKYGEIEKTAFNIYTFYHQLTNQENTLALREIGRWFDTIEVDYLRQKAIVKLTGELWAGTTEGEGNYNMHRFLEEEGAEILVEPVATYILFMLHKHLLRQQDKKEVIIKRGIDKWWHYYKLPGNFIDYKKKVWILNLGVKLYKREYNRLLHAMNGRHGLVSQEKLQKLAHQYYHTHIEGGEGFMEVAKNIYYHVNHKCHMVLSLKPFGCMPSTQSDGVQTAVIERHPEMIFIPVETSGEGRTNAHNRVLMALSEAKTKLKSEFHEALEKANHDLTDLQQYIRKNPELRKAYYDLPKQHGVVSKAANLIYHVDKRMLQSA